MGIVLGIDVGGSTTKIVAYKDSENLIGTSQVKATDQITSMYGAIGNLLHNHKLSLDSISKIVLTGVGASFIDGNVYGIPTYKVNEFEAIGFGGLRLTNLDEAIVISMGTGTAFVHATNSEVTHIGGSGVGGGTLLGLSSKLINGVDISTISMLAEKGDLKNVDLVIQDIYNGKIPNLKPHTTASNFGNIKNTATNSDLSLGLINMVFQTIGMMGIFACRNSTVKNIVLTGTLTTLLQIYDVFYELSNMYDVKFIIPPNAIFATAIGATVKYCE